MVITHRLTIVQFTPSHSPLGPASDLQSEPLPDRMRILHVVAMTWSHQVIVFHVVCSLVFWFSRRAGATINSLRSHQHRLSGPEKEVAPIFSSRHAGAPIYDSPSRLRSCATPRMSRCALRNHSRIAAQWHLRLQNHCAPPGVGLRNGKNTAHGRFETIITFLRLVPY